VSQLLSKKRHHEDLDGAEEPQLFTDNEILTVLHRSRAARNHLQDLLERSDQKAGFVVTGIAFLGLLVQQGNFSPSLTLAALAAYGLSFICVCITALPRKWQWYKPIRADLLYSKHHTMTLEAEARESCHQESDLRQIYRQKNAFLFVGFMLLIVGMCATLLAVFQSYFW